MGLEERSEEDIEAITARASFTGASEGSLAHSGKGMLRARGLSDHIGSGVRVALSIEEPATTCVCDVSPPDQKRQSTPITNGDRGLIETATRSPVVGSRV